MLVGFFKEVSAKNCDARIVGYCDRIWANTDLSLTVLRVFSLAISPSSEGSLKRLHMLVGPALESIRGSNDTAFDKDLYWNSPEHRTTAQYEIVKTPSVDVRRDRGRINDDLLSLDVYADRDITLSETSVGNSSLLTLDFPGELKAGERVQSRVRFKIPNALVIKNPNAPRTEYVCDFKYFCGHGPLVKEAVRLLGGNDCWVPIIARPPSSKEGTGVTIVFYAPPGFTKGDGFGVTTVEALDTRVEDGSQSQNRVKLLWQVDELLERDRVDPNEPISSSSYIHISGSLVESDDGKQIRELQTSLKAAEGTIDSLKHEVRWGTIIAVAGAVIAIAGIIIVLWPK